MRITKSSLLELLNAGYSTLQKDVFGNLVLPFGDTPRFTLIDDNKKEPSFYNLVENTVPQDILDKRWCAYKQSSIPFSKLTPVIDKIAEMAVEQESTHPNCQSYPHIIAETWIEKFLEAIQNKKFQETFLDVGLRGYPVFIDELLEIDKKFNNAFSKKIKNAFGYGIFIFNEESTSFGTYLCYPIGNEIQEQYEHLFAKNLKELQNPEDIVPIFSNFFEESKTEKMELR